MKRESADKQDGSGDTLWPTVLKIQNGEEFRQSLALAELAVRLCELKISKTKTAPTEKENLDPEKFLDKAWRLVQKAREHVSREQTDAAIDFDHVPTVHCFHDHCRGILKTALREQPTRISRLSVISHGRNSDGC